MRTALIVALTTASCLPVSLWAQNAPDKPKADLIFTHGNVYTGSVDPSSMVAGQRAEAIAIREDRILAVGTRDEVLKTKGPDTKIVDLGGHFVMPGFNDAHLHLAHAGQEKLSVNLVGVKTLDEFRERVRSGVAKAGPGEWVIGSGWDETLWPVKVTPTRWDLDEVAAGHPIYLDRVD